MKKTLGDYRKITGFGRGLAANQVGISKRVDGVVARLIGHELAHLRGKLCLDEAIPSSLRVIIGSKAEVFGQKLRVIRDI